MSRAVQLLIALGAVALVTLAFLFLIKPKLDEANELRVEAEDLQGQQATVRTQIQALQDVRSRSPNLEAELAAVSAVIPEDPALPAALRQLQMAADDSGVTLVSVSPSTPANAGIEDAPRLASITVNLAIEGGYFQVVDFLRRIEDPVITARGFLIQDVGVSTQEYPTLTVSVAATMFSLLDAPAEATPEPEPTGTETATEDADVEVDVDVTEEEDAA